MRLITRLMGWTSSLNAACLWAVWFHSASRAWSAFYSGMQASMALAPVPATEAWTGRPRTVTYIETTPTWALIKVSPEGLEISAASGS